VGEVALHLPSLACLLIYSSWARVPSPLQWSFPHTATFTSFPTPSLLGGGCHSHLLQLACLFTVLWGIVPTPLFGPQGTLPSLLCVFFCCCLLFGWFFSHFYLDGGQSVQGAMLIWPRVVCGSTTCCLAHLVVCFSWAGRSWHLAVWEPSWFLRLTWSGDPMPRLGMWRSQNFASSLLIFLQSISPVSLQDFTLGSMISASSL
jgi:hypothetical protein